MTVLTLSGGLALDLGTTNTLIYRKGGGLVVNEPSLAALETKSRRVLAVGREAKEYLGRTPKGLEVVRPLKGGLISDFPAALEMIRRFLDQAGAGRRFFRPKIVLSAPSKATRLEKRALIEAAEQAGGKTVHLVNKPLAAALGLGLDITEPAPQLVLDVGGGAAEGVIISLGATAFSECRATAGDEATLAVIHYLRRKFSLTVGENMAERIKMTIGSALPLSEEEPFPCRGKETLTGIPREMRLTREDLVEALAGVAGEFADLVKLLLSQVPPDIAADLGQSGLNLTGGGSLLAGLDQRLTLETGLEVHYPKDPLLSVILGLGEILENFHHYKPIFIN